MPVKNIEEYGTVVYTLWAWSKKYIGYQTSSSRSKCETSMLLFTKAAGLIEVITYKTAFNVDVLTVR